MKTAIVIGCATCVWDDVDRAYEIAGGFDKVYCVKLAGVHWRGKFDVWVTLHPEFMDDYEKMRKVNGFPGGYEIVAPLTTEVGMHGGKGRIDRRVTYRWPKMTSSASSGIYGAKVALDDGHDRVVLAGCPMTKEDGHFTRGKPWLQQEAFVRGFEMAIPHMVGKVRSMSGLSKKVLGEPTPEWLMPGSGEPAGATGETPTEAARG